MSTLWKIILAFRFRFFHGNRVATDRKTQCSDCFRDQIHGSDHIFSCFLFTFSAATSNW